MHALIGWNIMLYQSTDAQHSVCTGKLKTFLARTCKLVIKFVFLQIKANFITHVSKAIL